MPRKRTTWERTPDNARRDNEAGELRAQRLSYAQIADRMGYYDRSGAYKAVQRCLQSIPRETAEEILRQELISLDALDRAALEVLHREHYVVSDGQIVRDQDRQPLLDAAPVLRAIEVLRRNGESRRKLVGADAPARVEVSDKLTTEIERLAADLGVSV